MLLSRIVIKNIEKAQLFEKKLTNLKSGIIGENRLVKMVENYQYPFPNRVVNDVSLNAGGKFQIDCLILTPNLILFFESKNIGGKLYFEKNPERLVREKENGEVNVYESPEVQVERNETLFKWWLEQRGLKVPVAGTIVFTSATPPLIMKEPERIPALFPKSIVVYAHQKWNEFRARKQYLSLSDLDKLSEIIRAESVKNRYEQYPLSKSWNFENVQLVPGVRCLKCGKIGMERQHGLWACLSCGQRDRYTHITTLQEWFLFYKDTITNAECREYLMIPNRHLAKRLLQHDKILEFYHSKNTYYKWNG